MAILEDLRTGDPVIENGNYVQVEDDYAFYQVIDNLINCQLGTEVLNRMYGFDLKTAIQMNAKGASEKVLQSLLIEALDPSKEPLIKSIDSMGAWREGQEMNLKFTVSSKLDTQVTLVETIENAV